MKHLQKQTPLTYVTVYLLPKLFFSFGYLFIKKCFSVKNIKNEKLCGVKMTLDLGAGEHKRELYAPDPQRN